MEKKKPILVIYHGDCPDGFGGAWAAWKKFGNTAEYYPAARGVPPPKVKSREVYCIDFTYRSSSVVKKMARDAARLMLIDHHITAKPLMPLAEEYWFSLEHSGAVLAWNYFHPKKPVPKILEYVEDEDLWKFKLPHSRKISAYKNLFAFDFKSWDKLAMELARAGGRRKAADYGAKLVAYQDGIVRGIARHARLVNFEGRRVYAANSPVFDSEVGHELAKKKPPFGIVWREENGFIQISLRSNGEYDVSKIAEKYGGGGHKAAAGFTLKRGVKFPWR